MVLLVPLVLVALALLPQGNSQTPGSGPCRAPSLCILRTIPHQTLLGEPSYLVSNSTSQGSSFSTMYEFAELPG